jgi:hypothetical protein
VSPATYFLNLLEDKDRRLKSKLTLTLILRVNLSLVGYSIWSASPDAPHIKEGLRTTRCMSTSQPRCSQGNTQKKPSRWSLGELKDAFRSTRKPAVLDYEELGACQTRAHRTMHMAYILQDKGWDVDHALH